MSAVSEVAALVTDKIWKVGRNKLITYGMEQALTVLDPLCPCLIRRMLVFVFNKTASTAYSQANVQGFERSITYFFTKMIHRRRPAPVIEV